MKRYIKSDTDLIQEYDLPYDLTKSMDFTNFVQNLNVSPKTLDSAFAKFNAWFKREYSDEYNYYYKYGSYAERMRDFIKYMSDKQRNSLLNTNVGDIVRAQIQYELSTNQDVRY